MKKISLILIIMCLLSVSVFADELENTKNAQRDFNAIQTIYQNGAPHIDKNGNILLKYDKDKSFLTIALWGVPNNEETYGYNYDWKIVQDAGFNTVWPWPNIAPERQLELSKQFGFQTVLMHPLADDVLKKINKDPNLLANVWMDEPIGQFGDKMPKLFKDYQDYRAHVKKVAPNVKVFINDAPWITEPATSWWVKWNTEADISCHDNYPITNGTGAVNSIARGENGIPQSVSLAVASNKEVKPVWLIVGAFEQPGEYGQAFSFRFPTPAQLRSCVYSGIIHGATGIIFFAWDSYITREGNVVGMSPNPQVKINSDDPKYSVANPTQLVNSKANWDMMCQINKELKEITPSILSSTVSDFKYSIKVSGKAPTETPIRCLLKPDLNGGYILITCNQDDGFMKAEYTFDKGISSAEVLFENKKPLKIEDGKKISVSYEPFESHIIKIK